MVPDMQELINMMGCLVLFLSGHKSCPVQLLIPENILFDSMLIIGIGSKGFYVTKPLPKVRNIWFYIRQSTIYYAGLLGGWDKRIFGKSLIFQVLFCLCFL